MATNTTPTRKLVTIPITSGYSEFIELGDMLPVAIETPDAWTSANITVRARMSSSATDTGGVVFDDNPDGGGTQIEIAAAADRFVRLDERLFLGASHIAFAADGQAAARVIKVAMLPAEVLLAASGR